MHRLDPAAAAVDIDQRIAGEGLDRSLVAVRSPAGEHAQAVPQALDDQQVLIVVGTEIDYDLNMAGTLEPAHHRPQAFQRLLRRLSTGHGLASLS